MTSTAAEKRSPLRGLDEVERSQRRSRQVEDWNPHFTGDIDMVIARDGSWHYQGSPIRRDRMVKLFASILRRDDDGRYYLVTPVEKAGIKVEDAPFLAVSMQAEPMQSESSKTGGGADSTRQDQRLTFVTNVGDEVTAGADHPLRFEHGEEGGLKPYLHVRGRLEALVTRALVYDLVELAEQRDHEGRRELGVWSSGTFFPIGSADDLTKQ